MTGLVRRATLITAAGLLAATAAMAGVPSATTSAQPGGLVIKVVGHGSPPDPAGAVTYTIRDASNNPVPGSILIMNFSGCGEARICSSDVGAGMTVNCGAKTVSGVTNGAGQVTMVVAGAGPGNSVFSFSKCVQVTADGVPLSNLNAATVDYDGANGVDLVDVAACYSDRNLGTNRRRSDMDGNNVVDLVDVSAVYTIRNAAGSPASCTTLCP